MGAEGHTRESGDGARLTNILRYELSLGGREAAKVQCLRMKYAVNKVIFITDQDLTLKKKKQRRPCC
jgi:hypothetical protein